MGGATLSPRRAPQWRPARNRLVLALTFGLHLLAAVWLQQQHRPMPVRAEAPRVVTILLQLPAERARRAPAPVPTPAPAHTHTPPPPEPRPFRAQPPHTVEPDQAEAPRVPPPQTTPPPPASAPPAPAPSIADPLAAPQPAPAPADAASLARDPAASVHGSFTLGLARSEAGRIDHDLRGGKSGVPLEADTPWARFQRGLEAAHIDRSLSASLDSYTSPDGVVIYRERVGGRVTCRRTGSVGLGIAGARGVNDAGTISCPKGVTWKREY